MSAQPDDIDAAFERVDEPTAALAIRAARPNLALIDFAREREAAEDAVRNDLSANTLRAYATDWRAFTAWCDERGYCALPALPATIAMYLPHCAKTLKTASISRRIAAIAHKHRADGFDEPPTTDFTAKRAWKGIRRKLGTAQKGKDALTIDLLRRAVEPFGASRIDVRDRALLTVQFGAALRRSEICALNVSDIALVKEGLSVYIAFSKTDQTGEGTFLGVPYGSNHETCPVRAYLAWIATRPDALPDDPAFTTLYDCGRKANGSASVAGVTRLRPQAVAAIVKRRLKAAGIVGNFSGHSARSGFVTTAGAQGVDAIRIALQTRHKGLDMVRRYTRPSTIWKNNAAMEVGL